MDNRGRIAFLVFAGLLAVITSLQLIDWFPRRNEISPFGPITSLGSTAVSAALGTRNQRVRVLCTLTVIASSVAVWTFWLANPRTIPLAGPVGSSVAAIGLAGLWCSERGLNR